MKTDLDYILEKIKLKANSYSDNIKEIDGYLNTIEELNSQKKELEFLIQCYKDEEKPFIRITSLLSITLAFTGLLFNECPTWAKVFVVVLFYAFILFYVIKYERTIAKERKAKKIEMILSRINEIDN